MIPWTAELLPPDTVSDEWYQLQPMEDGKGPSVPKSALGKVRLKIIFYPVDKKAQLEGNTDVAVASFKPPERLKKLGGKAGWGMLKDNHEAELATKPRKKMDIMNIMSVWKSGNPMKEAGKRLFRAVGRGLNIFGKKKVETYKAEEEKEGEETEPAPSSGGFLSMFRRKTKKLQMVRSLSGLPKPGGAVDDSGMAAAAALMGGGGKPKPAWPGAADLERFRAWC
jgi:hypothetical protein